MTADLPSASFAAGQSLIRRPRHSAELAVRAGCSTALYLGGSVDLRGAAGRRGLQ